MSHSLPVAANGHRRPSCPGCEHDERVSIVGFSGVVDQPRRVNPFAKLIQHLLVETTTIGRVQSRLHRPAGQLMTK